MDNFDINHETIMPAYSMLEEILNNVKVGICTDKYLVKSISEAMRQLELNNIINK